MCYRATAIGDGGDDEILSRDVKPEFGFLTMDSTRKAVLLHPRDPQVARQPIIGVYVHGVKTHAQSALSCQRIFYFLFLLHNIFIL